MAPVQHTSALLHGQCVSEQFHPFNEVGHDAVALQYNQVSSVSILQLFLYLVFLSLRCRHGQLSDDTFHNACLFCISTCGWLPQVRDTVDVEENSVQHLVAILARSFLVASA